MKALLLLILLFISSLAGTGTLYKTPAFVVENKTLYCYDMCSKTIKEYIPGDILDGSNVVSKCSYNIESVEKIKEISSEKQTKRLDNSKIIIVVIIATIVLFFLLFRKL